MPKKPSFYRNRMKRGIHVTEGQFLRSLQLPIWDGEKHVQVLAKAGIVAVTPTRDCTWVKVIDWQALDCYLTERRLVAEDNNDDY